MAPDKQSLLSTNQTCASVNLAAWMDGGCPINLFAVRYRQQRQQQWVSAAVTGQVVTLEDLIPATWYRLQVTAHNEAGSTDAEYTFVTSPLHYVAGWYHLNFDTPIVGSKFKNIILIRRKYFAY